MKDIHQTNQIQKKNIYTPILNILFSKPTEIAKHQIQITSFFNHREREEKQFLMRKHQNHHKEQEQDAE